MPISKILSGPSMKPEAHVSLFHSGSAEAVSNFVEKTMSYVILGNDRICHFFDKKNLGLTRCQTKVLL